MKPCRGGVALILALCGLHPYVLNREPALFENFRFLVDGSHWQGQKKLKKADKTGKGGHLGCSTGYNFNIYKPHLDAKINSQMHSTMENCTKSLRLKNYQNFMRWLIAFFAIRNLNNQDLI